MSTEARGDSHASHSVNIRSGRATIEGDLVIPPGARGIVLFAHDSGGSRFSQRNRWVASELQWSRFGTLLVDLLTEDEGRADELTGRYRFDISLLGQRVIDAVDWLTHEPVTHHLPIGVFGASTGAAAALVAAARRPGTVRALVSRGGRPDLADHALGAVRAPTLLIVGGDDSDVLVLNRAAHTKLTCERVIEVVPGASHLFPEPGALETVATLAREWFTKYLYDSAAGDAMRPGW